MKVELFLGLCVDPDQGIGPDAGTTQDLHFLKSPFGRPRMGGNGQPGSFMCESSRFDQLSVLGAQTAGIDADLDEAGANRRTFNSFLPFPNPAAG